MGNIRSKEGRIRWIHSEFPDIRLFDRILANQVKADKFSKSGQDQVRMFGKSNSIRFEFSGNLTKSGWLQKFCSEFHCFVFYLFILIRPLTDFSFDDDFLNFPHISTLERKGE